VHGIFLRQLNLTLDLEVEFLVVLYSVRIVTVELGFHMSEDRSETVENIWAVWKPQDASSNPVQANKCFVVLDLQCQSNTD
jgi:hypothetical protein